MEQFTKILTSNYQQYPDAALWWFGIICWVADLTPTHVFRSKIHSSAIAIAAGLLLAWLGSELTGGKKGLSDIAFSGIALMGGGMVSVILPVSPPPLAWKRRAEKSGPRGRAGAGRLYRALLLPGSDCCLGLRLYRCGQHGDYRRRRSDLYCRPGYRRGAWRKLGCYRAQYRCRSD